MNRLSEKKIEQLLSVYHDFKKVQSTQKKNGLNEFNLFTALLEPSDEVRLHSRFLHALLNPLGSHGQDELFLELFLKECGLSYFSINASNCHVYKEYSNIDLYITDGTKHIIIENKLFACDQEKQIERYINTIKKENQRDEMTGDLVVIYLSLDRFRPSQFSLGEYTFNDNLLKKNNECYPIKVITYKNEILNWVKYIHKKIVKIKNLSIILSEYEDVILMLYNQYKGKLMKLEEYINSQDDSIEIYRNLKAINSEYTILKNNIIKKYFNYLEYNLAGELESEWFISFEFDKMSTRWGTPFKIKKTKDSKVIFALEFTNNDFHDLIYGICRRDKDISLDTCKNNKNILNLIHNSTTNLSKSSAWWLKYDLFIKGDLFLHIIENGGPEVAAKKCFEDIIKVFNAYKQIIIKCNEIV